MPELSMKQAGSLSLTIFRNRSSHLFDPRDTQRNESIELVPWLSLRGDGSIFRDT